MLGKNLKTSRILHHCGSSLANDQQRTIVSSSQSSKKRYVLVVVVDFQSWEKSHGRGQHESLVTLRKVSRVEYSMFRKKSPSEIYLILTYNPPFFVIKDACNKEPLFASDVWKSQRFTTYVRKRKHIIVISLLLQY